MTRNTPLTCPRTYYQKRNISRFGKIHARVAQRGRLTDLGIKTLSAEMTHFFNTVVLDLDGTAVQFMVRISRFHVRRTNLVLFRADSFTLRAVFLVVLATRTLPARARTNHQGRESCASPPWLHACFHQPTRPRRRGLLALCIFA